MKSYALILATAIGAVFGTFISFKVLKGLQAGRKDSPASRTQRVPLVLKGLQAGRKDSAYWSKNQVKSKASCEVAYTVHQLVNKERKKRGLPSLAYDHHLAYIARGHSKDMAHYDYLGHDNHKGESPTDRAIRKGYNCFGSTYSGIGENCHQIWNHGYDKTGKKYRKKLDKIASEAVRGWMKSDGHRANILNPRYQVEGVGFAISKKGWAYITQNLYG